jgi:tetratricopeptide (TPR) repeat protein
MEIPPDALARVRDLYDRGLCLQAYSAARDHGDLREWEGTAARLLAARIAGHVGAPRLSLSLFLLAGRKAPADLETQCYGVRALLGWRGPLAAWEALQRRTNLETPDPKVRADWLALHADVLGALRDFDAAEDWLARALAAAPEDAWVHVERAHLFEREDRYEDCLAAAERALVLRPWYPPAVGAAAHALTLLGRDAEAVERLREGAERTESGPIAAQRAALELELGRYQDAERTLERLADLSPLMDDALARWLAGLRSDVAYHLGDGAKAAELARRAGDPFHQRIADRLTNPASDGRRILLPVGFVRQHHMTCSPATLSAIGRFWSKPAEHLGIAEAICYDGTPGCVERQWVERNGWRAQEFTVTWDSAAALLERGVPFTLATVHATRAHMQAVIGYDARRGTLLVRDPFQRGLGEALADDLLASQRASGPRGLALVPAERADLLDGVVFPEAALYDRLYRLQVALLDHDRRRAREIYDGMAAEAPGHRLALMARWTLAAYDADPAALLACHQRLVELFP